MNIYTCLLGLILLLSGCTCQEYKVIKEVGGCDKYGYCGVLFEDGTTGGSYYAVKGEKACFR